MLAGLLSHLRSASSDLSRDSSLRQQRSVTERVQHSNSLQADAEASRRRQEEEVRQAVAACDSLLQLLSRKEAGARCGWMRRLADDAAQWTDCWLWTREAAGQVSIAWRVNEMTEVWRVVKEEEAKDRRQRQSTAAPAAAAAAATAGRREEDGELAAEEWTDADERGLQRMLEDERAKEASSSIRLGLNPAAGSRLSQRTLELRQGRQRAGREASGFGRPDPAWRSRDETESGRQSGYWGRETEKDGQGGRRGEERVWKRGRDDEQQQEEEAERAADAEREPAVSSARDSTLLSPAAAPLPAAPVAESEAQRQERELRERATEEETQRLLDAV